MAKRLYMVSVHCLNPRDVLQDFVYLNFFVGKSYHSAAEQIASISDFDLLD